MGSVSRTAVLLVLWLTAGARAEAYDEAPCQRCHAALGQGKVVHGMDGACADCHAPTELAGRCKGPVAKGWKLTQPDPQLCLECHEVKKQTALHAVIPAMGCSACHDPHSSDFPNHLVKWPAAELCYECHDAKNDKKSVHTAVSSGDCAGCHDPHSGAEAPLLKVARAKLCAECHEPQALLPRRYRHAPAAEGACGDCHDPHQSDLPKQTLRAGKAQCLECHDKKAPESLNAPRPANRIDLGRKVVHAGFEMGECQDCHAPGHTADYRKLLVKAPAELCYDCHDRLDARPYAHGAVKLGDCAVCHNPHTSNNERLLRAGSIQKLCFRCHDDDLTGRPYIHTALKKGDCGQCHDPHGGDQPNGLRQGDGAAACASCHPAQTKPDLSHPHKPVLRFGCVGCHDPHGAGNAFLLTKKTNDLCASCHTTVTDGLHVGVGGRGGHKVKGGRDTHDEDRAFSCASCHDPHGSNSPKILRFGEMPMDVCDWCHGDRTGEHPELRDLVREQKQKRARGKKAPTPAPEDPTP